MNRHVETITYRGIRVNGRLQVNREDGCTSEPLKHIVRHSPTGFEAGYGGSGPADLALSLLWDCCGEAEASHYQAFKWLVVAQLPHGGWTLTDEQIRQALQLLKKLERGDG